MVFCLQIPDDELTIPDRAKLGRIPWPGLADRLARFRRTPRGPSGFRGLTKARAKWKAQFILIPASGGKTKTVNLGHYDTERDAARAFDAALMTIEGIELNDRNFPDDPEPTTAAIEATIATVSYTHLTLPTIYSV